MTQKWPFKFSDIWSRYFFLIFPVFIVFIGFSELSSGFKNNLIDLIITSIIICIVGLLLLFFIAIRLYQNQRFDCFVISNLTVEQIEKVIRNNNFKKFTIHQTWIFCLCYESFWIFLGRRNNNNSIRRQTINK